MIDEKKIQKNIDYIKIMNCDGASPPLDEYWDEIIRILSQNMNETIEYLNSCDDEILGLITPWFEDIAFEFQNLSFIDELKKIQEKHPSIDMIADIEYAREAIL